MYASASFKIIYLAQELSSEDIRSQCLKPTFLCFQSQIAREPPKIIGSQECLLDVSRQIVISSSSFYNFNQPFQDNIWSPSSIISILILSIELDPILILIGWSFDGPVGAFCTMPGSCCCSLNSAFLMASIEATDTDWKSMSTARSFSRAYD